MGERLQGRCGTAWGNLRWRREITACTGRVSVCRGAAQGEGTFHRASCKGSAGPGTQARKNPVESCCRKGEACLGHLGNSQLLSLLLSPHRDTGTPKLGRGRAGRCSCVMGSKSLGRQGLWKEIPPLCPLRHRLKPPAAVTAPTELLVPEVPMLLSSGQMGSTAVGWGAQGHAGTRKKTSLKRGICRVSLIAWFVTLC